MPRRVTFPQRFLLPNRGRQLQIPLDLDLIAAVPRVVLVDENIVMARFFGWKSHFGVVFLMDLAVGFVLHFYQGVQVYELGLQGVFDCLTCRDCAEITGQYHRYVLEILVEEVRQFNSLFHLSFLMLVQVGLAEDELLVTWANASGC